MIEALVILLVVFLSTTLGLFFCWRQAVRALANIVAHTYPGDGQVSCQTVYDIALRGIGGTHEALMARVEQIEKENADA